VDVDGDTVDDFNILIAGNIAFGAGDFVLLTLHICKGDKGRFFKDIGHRFVSGSKCVIHHIFVA
jgi:hypothetical protein